MCSIHANSAREALVKLCTLPLLAGENISASFVIPTVATSVDLIVHTATDHLGQRRVREIIGIPGRVEGDVIETADIFTSQGDRLVRAKGYPPYPDRFVRLGLDLAALLAAGPEAGRQWGVVEALAAQMTVRGRWLWVDPERWRKREHGLIGRWLEVRTTCRPTTPD
ncbi:MAG: hypothetical protein ACR2FG_13905 [Marmoricola sp.]